MKNELHAALAAAQKELEPAPKDSTNPHFRSRYADLSSCWEAAQKVLSKNGLSISQVGESVGEGWALRTTLHHISGESLSGLIPLLFEAGRGNPMQALGSAITYARRYGLAAIIGLTAEDDDADACAAAPANVKRPGVQPAVKAPAVVLDSPGEHKIEAECTRKGVKISALPEQWLQASAREQRRQAALTPSDNANIRAFLDQRPAVAGIKPVDFSRAKPLSLEDDEVML